MTRKKIKCPFEAAQFALDMFNKFLEKDVHTSASGLLFCHFAAHLTKAQQNKLKKLMDDTIEANEAILAGEFDYEKN